MPKILIVSNSFPINHEDWVAPFSFAVTEELTKLGAQVSILTLERKFEHKEEVKWPIVRLPAKNCLAEDEGLSINSPKKLFAYYKLNRLAIKWVNSISPNEFDFAIAFWAFPSGYWLSHVKELNIPIMCWCLGSDIWKMEKNPISKALISRVLNRMDKLFADGYKLAGDASRLSNKDCSFLPTSRKLPDFSSADKNPNKYSRPYFIFVGRWEHVKGVDILIHAFSMIKDKSHDLLIFGLGSQEKEYRFLIEKLNVSTRVKMLGELSATDLSRHMSAAHFTIIPSRNESIPVILTDSIQLGTPVITSTAGDMGTVVRQYKIGHVFNSEMSSELSALLDLAAEENKEKYSENLKQAYSVFSPASTAKTIFECGKKLARN